jgi:hypothetical protein
MAKRSKQSVSGRSKRAGLSKNENRALALLFSEARARRRDDGGSRADLKPEAGQDTFDFEVKVVPVSNVQDFYGEDYCFDLNPTNSRFTSQIRDQMKKYSQFEILGVHWYFMPNMPLTEGGSIALTYNPDSDQDPYSYDQATRARHRLVGGAGTNGGLHLYVDPRKFGHSRKFMQHGGTSRYWSSAGTVQVATSMGTSASFNVGRVYIELAVRFWNPADDPGYRHKRCCAMYCYGDPAVPTIATLPAALPTKLGDQAGALPLNKIEGRDVKIQGGSTPNGNFLVSAGRWLLRASGTALNQVGAPGAALVKLAVNGATTVVRSIMAPAAGSTAGNWMFEAIMDVPESTVTIEDVTESYITAEVESTTALDIGETMLTLIAL